MKRLETSVTYKLQNKKCFRCYLLTIIVAGKNLEEFIENITITYIYMCFIQLFRNKRGPLGQNCPTIIKKKRNFIGTKKK